MPGSDALEAMWYCPDCELWIGSKLPRCNEGHDRPRYPVTRDVVDKPAHRVTARDRARAKLRRLVDG